MADEHSSSQMGGSRKTAILLGATGATGKEILPRLLSSDDYVHVHSFGRRETGAGPHEKLTEHTVDFEKLTDGDAELAAKFKDVKADSVIITLATTRGDAGSAGRFERIDREYVVAAAKAARNENVLDQRLVYLSATMASSKSPFLYPKSKGLTEEALGGIGYASTYFFRPGLLYGAQREKARPAEKLYSYFTHYVLSKVSASAEIAVPILASSIVETAAKGDAFLQTKGVKGSPFPQAKGSATILSNAEALKLGGQ